MPWFPALQTSGRMAFVRASRSKKEPHFQQRVINLLKLRSSHVCRALAISDVLDTKALSSEMLGKTLDVLAAGVFFTARKGHVICMNHAAERRVKTGPAIRIVNNRIILIHGTDRTALLKAVEAAARHHADTDTNGHRW